MVEEIKLKPAESLMSVGDLSQQKPLTLDTLPISNNLITLVRKLNYLEVSLRPRRRVLITLNSLLYFAIAGI